MDCDCIKNLQDCKCGKKHVHQIKSIIIGSYAINSLADEVKKLGCSKAFILADINTFSVAGEMVVKSLTDGGVDFVKFVFEESVVLPNEHFVGSAIMHFDSCCDVVVAVGSGVINDIGKILSSVSKTKYVIVGTAPSMDGYASSTSSVSLGGLKVSLPTRCADVIIGDTQIIKNAPMKMLKSGLGDMLAKYVSICEWRLSNIITGEYYCENIANLVRDSLSNCVKNAEKLLDRDEKAVESVFKGLIVCGVAMSYAGLSRPASGAEHYISHVLDMRTEEFNTPYDMHGIQCAIATLFIVKKYNELKNIKIDEQKALNHAINFDEKKHNQLLTTLVGKGAKSMIEQEKADKKYNVQKHAERLQLIISNWHKILSVINQEIPDYSQLESLFDKLSLPKDFNYLGVDDNLLESIFLATKDIRDKYVLSRLLWDLGIERI